MSNQRHLTNKEADAAHDVYLQIADEVVKIANTRLEEAKLTLSQVQYVRERLDETVRFWS